jgi:hypothetical protein
MKHQIPPDTAAVRGRMPDIAGRGMAGPAGTRRDGSDISVEQMDCIFHELHAESRHALCAVCAS